jgi:hypothetical protein
MMTTQPQAAAAPAADMEVVYSPPADLFPPPGGFPQTQVSIYVGNGYAAGDLTALDAAYVRGVLNVAYDLDDQPHLQPTLPLNADPHRPPPQPRPGSGRELKRYPVQLAKVGLIDGTGNPAGIMALMAAVYTAEQLFCFPGEASAACPPLVNLAPRGNLLIHCWSGGSRSVTVAALYIWYKFGVQLNDPAINVAGRSDAENFLAVYNHVKAVRGDATGTPTGPVKCQTGDAPSWVTPPPPTYGMQQGAMELVSTYSALFPRPVVRT